MRKKIAKDECIECEKKLSQCKCKKASCNLRKARWSRGISRSELAKLIGVHPNCVSNMEWENRIIGELVARRIGEALNVPWRNFLSYE